MCTHTAVPSIVERIWNAAHAASLFPSWALFQIAAVALGALLLARASSRRFLAPFGIGFGDFAVLRLLQEAPGGRPLSPTRLAELIDVSLSNATGLIDRMEERGLVERVRVPDDRRIVLVRPAAAGLKALSETEGSKRDSMRAVVNRLSPDERRVAIEAIRSFRRALSAEGESSAAVHQHHFVEAIN